MRWLLVRQRAHRRRHTLVNTALITIGLFGALAGAWVIGWWALGLVAVIEAAGFVYVGFARDDGEPLPVRGARTVEQVFDDERLRP
jgi:hypothetical protein